MQTILTNPLFPSIYATQIQHTSTTHCTLLAIYLTSCLVKISSKYISNVFFIFSSIKYCFCYVLLYRITCFILGDGYPSNVQKKNEFFFMMIGFLECGCCALQKKITNVHILLLIMKGFLLSTIKVGLGEAFCLVSLFKTCYV